MKLALSALLAAFRYQAFWWMDRLKGGPVKSHYKDIVSRLDPKNAVAAQAAQAKALEALLQHAVNTIPFYKDKAGTPLDLVNFPVVTKSTLVENTHAFKSSTYLSKPLTTRKTSGSTGTPFAIVHDGNKVQRNTADNLYFSMKAGYQIGYSLYYIRHWNPAYKKSKLQNWLQNLRPIEAVTLKPDTIEALLKQMSADPTRKGILGFPSALELVCKYLDAKNAAPLPFKVNSAIAMAEALNSYTKQKMAYYFNTNMVSRYSNMEAGILAQETTETPSVFTVNTASYHIEVLKLEDDSPAPEGSLGRIVITDLYNYAMPLIRYDTGDLGQVELKNNQPVFTRIEGRKSDTIYDTKGHVVSAFMMTTIVNYPNINQVQFIQYGKTAYELKLNVNVNFNLEAELKTQFKQFLGEDATLNINYVDDIPLLASGKRKYTLNTYHNSL